jgi:ABC-type multidrug transport system ATPase subunit
MIEGMNILINTFVSRKTTMDAVIKVSHLCKNFGDVKAVDDLSFSVQRGEVYGFLGQNGAGKSTTIRMLLTLIRPASGEIEISGLNLQQHRKDILKKTGAIIEKPDLYKYLTALENIRLFAVLSGIKVDEKQLMDQLHKVGLAERAGSKVKTFSQGMKQRLGIAVALVHDPDLIILDEPMNGLDPQGIADIRHLIIHLSKDLGKTVFISSHLLSEMEQVADSLLIIDKGKKVVEGKMEELLNPETTDVEIETDATDALMQQLQQSQWGGKAKKTNSHKIILQMKREQLPEFIRVIGQTGLPVFSVRPRHSLEDYFLSLTAN